MEEICLEAVMQAGVRKCKQGLLLQEEIKVNLWKALNMETKTCRSLSQVSECRAHANSIVNRDTMIVTGALPPLLDHTYVKVA